jgi:PAS domain S-box-containing protein
MRAPDFRAIFESVPGLYLVLEPDLTIVAASDGYLRATMTKREQILGRALFDVFPEKPDAPNGRGMRTLAGSLGRVLEHHAPDAIAGPRYVGRGEANGDAGAGRCWSFVNEPVLGADGELAYIIHRVEDARADGEPAESAEGAERCRQIVENIDEVMWMAGVGMRSMLYISPAYERVWGRTRESLYATPRSWLDALHPEDRDRVLEHVLARMAEGASFEQPYRIVRPNGEVRWVHDRGFPVRNKQGEVDRYVGIAKDITELRNAEENLRRSEEQLNQAKRMEAVGRLAGGVAHDFNNLMTAVAGYTRLILQRLDDGDPLRKEVEEIRKAGDRATALTRQLLAFGRKQVLQPKVLNLNPIVADMEKMLRRLIGEHIELVFVPGRDLGNVNADPSQLEQVVVNLALNARDAMGRGGKLTLGTRNVLLDGTYATRHVDVASGPYVLLAVTDTGVGMAPETLSRLFEPFFTTKVDGMGAGFGLSTVYGIVKQSGGHVDVYSELGRGSTFEVYLPRVDDVPLPSAPRGPVGRRAARGTETILLIEDDDLVRDVTRTILVAYGYSVLEARDADEALLLSERYTGHVHLMLTDIVMPRMDGRQLAARIARGRPAMRVIYMSGYTENAVLLQGETRPSIAFIQKPFTPEDLALKVREVLEGA